MLSDEEIRKLYNEYSHIVYRRCRRILRDEEEARDAVQDIFCLVMRYRRTFLRRSMPLNWLHRVTTNYCLRQLGRHKCHTEDLSESTNAEPADKPSDEAIRRDLVLKLLEHFDQKTQTIAICTFVEGLLQEETAQIMGISSRAVRKRLESFKKKARHLALLWQKPRKALGETHVH